MSTQVFVNLPTKDLEKSKAFFTELGWSINANFSSESAACVVIDENIFLMILVPEFFATFTEKPIVDPHTALQVEVSLSADSKDAVNAMVDKAVASGGAEHRPVQDLGFMYGRTFDDPDGNQFSIVWMDPAAVAHEADQAE